MAITKIGNCQMKDKIETRMPITAILAMMATLAIRVRRIKETSA